MKNIQIKKERFLFGLVIIFFMVSGCTKIKKYEFRFEIVTSVPVVPPSGIVITMAGEALRETSTFYSGAHFSHTNALQTASHPIFLALNANTIHLSSAGTATYKIYVNNELKVSEVINSINVNGQPQVNPYSINYTIP